MAHNEPPLRHQASFAAAGGDGGREPPAPGARPGRANESRRRLHHRHRHFRPHRNRRARQGGPGAHALVRDRRRGVRSGGALLRGVRLHGARCRLGIHLRLRDAGRVVRLDHRLGSGFGIHDRRRDRSARLVALFSGLHRHLRFPLAARADELAVRLPAEHRHARRDRHGVGLPVARHRRVRHGDPDRRHPRERDAQLADRRGQSRHCPVRHRRRRALRRPEELDAVRALRLHRRLVLRPHAPGAERGRRRAARRARRRGDDLFRLHWLRFGLDARRGGASPAAGGAPLGVLAGAAIIFFAYIGFDSVSTHAEEARHPQRDVPIGIIASLLICTVLYVGVSAVLTGMVPYDKIHIDAPVSDAFRQAGLPWAQFLISLGALAGITSVLLVLMLSQPRIFLAMARDGLVPPEMFGAVHPRFRTPYKSTILTGIVVGLCAAFIPLRILAELVNIGTLLAFVIVCAAVLIMRKKQPDAPRPFRCPFVPLVPLLGIALCLVLMFSLPAENWLRLFVWLVLGLIIYILYGRHHSVLARARGEAPNG